jgi:hypothetical protein
LGTLSWIGMAVTLVVLVVSLMLRDVTPQAQAPKAAAGPSAAAGDEKGS